MSLEMCFWLVSNKQLLSFQQRPGAFYAFSQSTRGEEAVVNHRNVRLFHFLPTGTKKRASGPLRIFETWFLPHRCADLLIDDSVFGMDPYGLDAADTQALLDRLKALPNTELRARAGSYAEMLARRERLWSWMRRPRVPIVAATDD